MFFKIGPKKLGPGYKPLIVAEISANHDNNLKKTLKLIDIAKKVGADAIKFQTYTANSMTLNLNKKKFLVQNKNSPFFGKKLYDLYDKGHMPWKWYNQIIKRAKKNNLIFFSTPFDYKSTDFLNKLKVPCFKIASFECNDLPLISHVAKKKKPIIISTGMATYSEIDEAIKCVRKNGLNKIILLKCTSSYPAKEEDYNLNTIPYMRKKFKCLIGVSDHTLGSAVSVAAITHGAVLIEKHLKYDDKSKSADAKFSFGPKKFREMVDEINLAYKANGKVYLGPSKSEILSRKFRRSLIVVKKIKKGELITKQNVRVLRPAIGAEPKNYYTVQGKKTRKDLKVGDPLRLEDLKI